MPVNMFSTVLLCTEPSRTFSPSATRPRPVAKLRGRRPAGAVSHPRRNRPRSSSGSHVLLRRFDGANGDVAADSRSLFINRHASLADRRRGTRVESECRPLACGRGLLTGGRGREFGATGGRVGGPLAEGRTPGFAREHSFGPEDCVCAAKHVVIVVGVII
jgi:hypothetical protein